MKHGHSAGEAPPSMWVRNVQLASFSIVIGTAQLFGRMLTMETKPLLHGFNVRVWIMVFNNAVRVVSMSSCFCPYLLTADLYFADWWTACRDGN